MFGFVFVGVDGDFVGLGLWVRVVVVDDELVDFFVGFLCGCGGG